jgi:hypothetical protein
MGHVKLGGLAILIGMIGLTATISGEPAAKEITTQPVSYADLGKLVRSHRGKVLVVDFWSLG